MKRCEDCGEPAARQTADGVWLCEGDYELCFDRYFADTYEEGDHAKPSSQRK